MKGYINAVIFSLAIIIGTGLLANAYKNRNVKVGDISVTGLGETNFTSDLIVWNAQFTAINYDLKQAYNELKRDKKMIKEYLISKGLKESEIVFSAAASTKNFRTNYSSEGKYLGEVFNNYSISQKLQINSKNVEKTEKISREITELLNEGIEITSSSPRYYYTKLEELKVDLISRATENARIRAEKIAENSNSSLGNLKDAKMGIFQITGQNSGEAYSWGGSYNTASKHKTASITIKLNYLVD